MKILILGIGRQGGHILELLLQKGFTDIHVFDIKYGLLEDQERRFKSNAVTVVRKDIFSMTEKQRIEFLRQYRYIIDALPAQLSYKILHSAVCTGSAVISISFLEEDFLELDEAARQHNSLLIPDCGAAPGLSHLLAGNSVKRFGGADRVVMKLGAIPLQPHPPFYHNITWSIEDLIQEYIRPARIKHGGVITRVDPFDAIEDEHIFDISLESFISDGVRSFLASFPDIPEVTERTLRHKGHLDFMKAMKALNLLSCQPIRHQDMDIEPCRFLAQLIEQNFSRLPGEDYFIMEIMVQKDQRRDTHYYFMEYDYREGLSALVKAVAVTAVETLLLIRDGVIATTGVHPLERLADETVCSALIKAHEHYGAKYELISE